MGQRTARSEKSTVRLIVRKETVRRLQTVGEDELRGIAGGVKGPPPPPPPVPSHVTC